METRSSPPAAGARQSFKRTTGLRRILNALRYSLAGLAAAYRHEAAFRQETWLALALVPAALLLPASAIGLTGLTQALLLADRVIHDPKNLG